MSIYLARNTKFHDGKTSAVHYVTVTLTGKTLSIANDGKTIMHQWPLDTVSVVQSDTDGLPPVITSTRSPNARLHLNDRKGWKTLKDRLPKKAGIPVLPENFIAYSSYLAVGALSLYLLFLLLPRLVSLSAPLIPLSWEQELGKHVAQSIAAADTCNAPDGQKALEQLAERLAQHMKRDVPYDIRVIDTPQRMNAFAAPGGYIVIYNSLIENANSPDEVAGVLAHEMAHIELYHTTQSVLRAAGLSLTLKLMLGDTGLDRLAGVLTQMRYSRHDERAADIMALKVLKKAGISHQGLAGFLKQIQKMPIHKAMEEQASWLGYLSSHPKTEERIALIMNTEPYETSGPALPPTQWQALRRICSQTHPTVFE